jgi:oligoendopeptidase F
MAITESKKLPPAPRWDLESIFSGGSESKDFEQFRKEIRKDLIEYTKRIELLPDGLDGAGREGWTSFVVDLQTLLARVRQAMSFVHCLISQDVNDEKAHQINGETDVFGSEFEKLMVSFEAFAKKQDDSQWREFINGEKLKEVSFALNEIRDIALKKMAPEFEAFATELAVNGYHAWNRLYDKMYGDLAADFEEDGEIKKLSLGQLQNRMSSANRDIRRQAFEKLEEAWGRRANLASMALNFQAGFRLTLYEKRNWDVLTEPLNNCRMTKETLDAMWRAVEKGIPGLVPYIEAKKKLMGTDKFNWYDQPAPIGASEKLYSFEESGDFIVNNIRPFSEAQANFSRMALDRNWIEAEDRPGKAGGGFCTGFRVARESRIFMTYSGSFSELATLAHELGHAWHSWLLKDKPVFASHYPSTLAETASIFNELLVKDAALEKTDDDDEKLMLLDQKLQDAQALFCNIYARYLLDRAFYEERKNGLVSKTRLDELMVNAQKKAFGGMLDPEEGYHPLFWASKLHFFLTDVPFYNFPYTFGYLFAGGVYARAKKEGASFDEKYQALLADTGSMTSEDVARKHLGVDLTKEDFWTEAVNNSLADVKPFVALADKAGQ